MGRDTAAVRGVPGSVAAVDVAADRRTPFRPDIEGLRALAVTLVVVYHAGVPWLPGGYVGVDVFFVISGFLITNHLATELTRTGRLRFAQFYARRARRILPASFLVLVVTTVAAALWMPPLRTAGVTREIVATALYVPNLLFARQGTEYLAETSPSPVQHYWSLGVEEQFYLLWPAALALSWLLVRHVRRRLVLVVGLVVVSSFALGVLLTPVRPSWAFFSLPTRAWELGVGGLAALTLPRVARSRVARSPLLVAAGLAAVVAAGLVYDASTPFPGVAAAVPVLGTALAVVAGTSGTGGAVRRVLGWRPVQAVGRWSYSLYLWHWPLLVIPASRRLALLPLWQSVGLSLVAVALAAATYRLVERPMRALPALTSRPPRWSLLAAGASSVVVVALAVVCSLVPQSRPLATDREAPVTTAVRPTFTGYVPANLRPSLADVADDLPVAYRDGCHQEPDETALSGCSYGDTTSDRVVALFGDSHAAQWLPAVDALARSRHLRVALYTKSACQVAIAPGVGSAACRAWRERALRAMAESAPELVLVSNFMPRAGTSAAFGTGLGRLFDRLPSTSRVVLLGTTPTFPAAPATCLSAHLTGTAACGAPRELVLPRAVLAAERQAAARHGAVYVDAADRLCSATTCGAIAGDVLLYRDDHHLTTVASTGLEDLLAPALDTP